MSTASPTFDSELAELRADVAQQGAVIASAVSVFNSLVSKMATAEQKAVTAGATPDQIAAVTQIRLGLESNTVALASAIHANTDGGPVEEVAPAAPALPAAPEGSKPLVPPIPTPTGVVVDTPNGPVETPTLTPTTGGTTELAVTEQPAAPEQGASPEQPAT